MIHIKFRYDILSEIKESSKSNRFDVCSRSIIRSSYLREWNIISYLNKG